MSDILNQFRDEELPVSTVDISRAMRSGRRRRARTALTVAGAVVAVAAAGTVASVLLSPQPSSSPIGPAPTSTCGVTPSAPPSGPSPTWEYFDPLTYEIDASGVTGYRLGAMTTSTYWQVAQLFGDTSVSVALYATGGEPHSFTDETLRVDPADGAPAGTVNGTPAYWLEPSDPTALAWQWTTGAWAIVHASPPEPGESPTPLNQDDLRVIAMQVAQQLEFGAGTPVASPFSLPIPYCMYPALTMSFHTTEDGGPMPTFVGLGFDPLGTAAPTHVGGYVPHLWVNAYTAATVDYLPEGATEYPEDLGYPAYQADQRAEGRDSYILWVLDVSGFGVEIEPRHLTGTPEQRLAYAADVFRTLTFYPDAATDLTAWGDPIAP